jgi:hypothetical protein
MERRFSPQYPTVERGADPLKEPGESLQINGRFNFVNP